jgi:hypothetical protein
MTEAEWLTADDSVAMLFSLLAARINTRKFASFAFGAFSQICDRLDEPMRQWLMMAERTEDKLQDTIDDSTIFKRELLRHEVGVFVMRELQRQGIESRACSIVRDIFGNPFRPIAFDPTWLTPTVVALAKGIYVERAFDRMPILADALEEAGCDNAEVLLHCRGDGPHVKGCWVVDAVLGKE